MSYEEYHRSRTILNKLLSVHTNLVLHKEACTSSTRSREKLVLDEAVELLCVRAKRLLRKVRQRLYTTVCMVGSSGSGKTHFLNTLLCSGLNVPSRTEKLTDTILRQSLNISVVETFDRDICWTPQCTALGTSVDATADSLSHFFPDIEGGDDCACLLPEGDMLSSTTVPVHVFYGEYVAVSFSYISAAQVDEYLRALLTCVNACPSQDVVAGVSCVQEAHRTTLDDTVSRRVVRNDDKTVRRALRILGISPEVDINNLRVGDINLPQCVETCLGRVFTCSLKNCTLEQSLTYLKAILRSMLSGSNVHSSILEFVSIEIPCARLKFGVELVDLPGFGGEIFQGSSHSVRTVEQASRLIHVCDGRKLGSDLARFLSATFLRRVIRNRVDWRIASICNNWRRRRHQGMSTELFEKARLGELINLARAVHTTGACGIDAVIHSHSRCCVLYVNSRELDSVSACVDFVLSPTAVDALRYRQEVFDFEEFRRLVKRHIAITTRGIKSRWLKTSSVREHLQDNFDSQFDCIRQKKRMEAPMSLFCKIKMLFDNLMRDEFAPAFASLRNSFWTSVNNTALQGSWQQEGRHANSRPHAQHTCPRALFEHFVHEALYELSNTCASSHVLRKGLYEVVACHACTVHAALPTLHGEQMSHVLLLKALDCVDDFVDSLICTLNGAAGGIVCKTREFGECRLSDAPGYFSERWFDTTIVILATEFCEDCIQVLLSKLQRIVDDLMGSAGLKRMDDEVSIHTQNFFTSCVQVLLSFEVDRFSFQSIEVPSLSTMKEVLREVLLAVGTICSSRCDEPYICTSLTKTDLTYVRRSVEYNIPVYASFNLYGFYSIIVCLRRVFGGSHRDFCFAIDKLACLDTLENFRECHEFQFSSTKVDEDALTHLIIKAVRANACQSLPSFNVGKLQVRKLICFVERYLQTETDSVSQHFGFSYSVTSDTIQATLRHLLELWGPSYVDFCRAAAHFSPDRIPTMTERSILLHESLQYLEREVLACESFFREWGSDILVSFFFFSLNARGRVQEYCFQASRRIGVRWLDMHQNLAGSLSREDVLFLNEALYALKRLELSVNELEDLISSLAPKWHLNEYVEFRRASPTYDSLNSVMIWSFFFRGTGMKVLGTTEEEVNQLCAATVKSLSCEAQMDSLKMFQEKCYFVTHRVFTHTAWCSKKPKSEDYETERRFLLYHLPYLQIVGDVELVGEFVQTLKCFGLLESDPLICKAVDYLMSRRDSRGAWDLGEHTFARTYHATVCALGAIIDS